MNELIEGMANDHPNEDEDVQEDDEEAVEPPVTVAELRSALSTLERGLRQTNFSDLENLENMQEVVKNHLRCTFSPKQTTLTLSFLSHKAESLFI